MPGRPCPTSAIGPTAILRAVLALATLSAPSCAGGPNHISEITPATSGTLSGIWVLQEQESDDPEVAIRAGGPGDAGQRPGGGTSPAAAQALRRMATVVPRRLELSLSDSAVVVAYPREEPWVLFFGESVKREVGEEVEVQTKAEWKDGLLAVTRRVSGAGALTETFYPRADRRRLTVVVGIGMRGRDEVEFRRVYQPEDSPPR